MIGDATCSSCILWELLPGIGRPERRLGHCRAHAPIMVAGSEGKLRTKWPLTAEGDWCGDHTLAVEAAE